MNHAVPCGQHLVHPRFHRVGDAVRFRDREIGANRDVHPHVHGIQSDVFGPQITNGEHAVDAAGLAFHRRQELRARRPAEQDR